jgi:MFS family permease
VWRDLVAGVEHVARRDAVRAPMLLAVLDNLLYGYLVVALVLLADDAGAGAGRLGLLNAALAAGALGAMLVVGRLAAGPGAPRVLVLSLHLFALCVAALGALGSAAGALPAVTGLLVAGLLVATAGVTTLVAEVTAVTLLQRAAEEHVLARVFGVYDQLNVGAIALGSFLAGPLAALIGPGAATTLFAVVCALLAAPATVRVARRGVLGSRPCPATSSSSPPSMSRPVVPSSSSRVLPAQRRPSGTLSQQH